MLIDLLDDQTPDPDLEPEDEGDELDTREASDEEVYGEDDCLSSEGAAVPSAAYRERLRQRRGERARRAAR